ncbi:deoxynucleotide monophosphate kinase family protein [Streptomyces sennicomposti]
MNIGIIGRARVGKDSAGQWLVDERGYRRVAFADPLKEAALKLDPIVGNEEFYLAGPGGGTVVSDRRLSEEVGQRGWEAAKDYPEVRRILQELGAAVRALDVDFWLRAAMKKVVEANDAGTPVVVTDVRYPNEAASLRRSGFHLVYIERPGVEQMAHESENALTLLDADYHIVNDGPVTSLLAAIESVWEDVHTRESRRLACKF